MCGIYLVCCICFLCLVGMLRYEYIMEVVLMHI